MKFGATAHLSRTPDSTGGFALIATLALLALLVLAVFALSALARVGTRIASASLRQTQARQNALLALEVALGKLQEHAGPDDRRTGMAGVVGVVPQNTFRQWAGVWGGGSGPVWLASGSTASAPPFLTGPRLTIVDGHSVGTPADKTDQENVEVGLIDVPGLEAGGFAAASGRMAYWVGDEGVKVSAIIGNDEVQASPLDGRPLRPNFRTLISSAFDPSGANNSRVIALEQLKETAGFSLFRAFHALTRSHAALASTAPDGTPQPGAYVIGAFNVNTTAASAWRALLEFPDASASASAFDLDGGRTLSAARQIGNRVAARGRPFDSIDDLLASNLIQDSFDAATPKITTITQEDFIAALRPILAVRSDTFRIRAYGDTLDSVGHSEVVASAWCEAIVQRTPDPAPSGLGRRFIVTYFRWLGPGDI